MEREGEGGRGRERVGCWKGNRRGEGNGVGGGEGGGEGRRGREGEGGGEGRGREEGKGGGGSKKKLSLVFFSKDNFEWLWYNL